MSNKSRTEKAPAADKPGQWAANAIEHWTLDRLIPYARNSRTHSDEQVAQIASSIKEFGFTNPILATSEGDIVAGHGRLSAAMRLKLESVPVIIIDHLSPAQRRALVIADNRIALNSGWDFDMLSVELDELNDQQFDLSILGFSPTELADLIGSPATPLDGMPNLPEGDREPFQQMTFTLHDSQAETVKRALEVARGMGDFAGSENENGNGNALARVCEVFLQGNSDD